MVDWKITGKKVLIQAVIVLGAGLASTYGNSPYYLALVPFINGTINAVKHWNK